MKRLKGGRGGKRKGVEVDQLLRGKGRRSRERSIPRRGNGRRDAHRSGENNHRRRAPILSRGDY